MKLLHLIVRGASLFEDQTLKLDFFAKDRVTEFDTEDGAATVHRVGASGAIFTQNVMAVTGPNASGKTTLTQLVRFVLGHLSGDYALRESIAGAPSTCGKLEPKVAIKAVFWHDGSFYLWEAELDHRTQLVRGPNDLDRRIVDLFRFEEEKVWKRRPGRLNRSQIIDIEAFRQSSVLIKWRNGPESDPATLSPSEARFLSPDRSIVSVVVGTSVELAETPERELPLNSWPAEVMQAFDSSIKRLEFDSQDGLYILQFESEEPRRLSAAAVLSVLSSGTVGGSDIVSHAISILKKGGYLIVDEIEDSLSRSLVEVIVGLFGSSVTNPHGATLVFTTHYPELLDLLHRKDNVYLLTRVASEPTRVRKYSDEAERIENKKSEIVLGNYVDGTLPSYEQAQGLRDYVRSQVNG